MCSRTERLVSRDFKLFGDFHSATCNDATINHDVYVIGRKFVEQTLVVSNQHKTPHNNYLYVWFELGILGLIVFLSIFYFQIKELIKKADGIFLILFPIMFLIIMFTDSYLFSQNTLVLSIITINH